MAQSLFSRVIVPVANKADAAATTEAILPHLDRNQKNSVLVVHVIEKAGGALDKASVEQRELAADEMFEIVSKRFRGVDCDLQTEYLYGTNVGEAIISAANEFDASAIVFTPRGGGRWLKILTGDVTTNLVNNSDVPVLVLPDESDSKS